MRRGRAGLARLAPPADDGVALLAAGRDVGEGDVRQAEEERVELGAGGGEPRVERGDLVAEGAAAGDEGVGQVYRTGLQLSTTAYESIAEAPNGGYQADSAVTAAVGQTVIAQFQSGGCTTFYAKVTVLGVDAASGVITLRGRVNPNCGYRSLNPGRG